MLIDSNRAKSEIPPSQGDSEDQLRASLVMAQASLFVRDAVLGMASHDLRGPLNAIHSWAHVLERRLPAGDVSLERALGGIRTGVEQQVRLIEEVLDVPRMATRALQIERAPTAVLPLLNQVLANLAVTFGAQREARLNANLAGLEAQSPSGALDAVWLWRATWLALAFAIEASPAGAAVTLDADLTERSLSLAISYQFAPESLTDENLAHAFEPFVRAEASAPRGRDGLPLGLSLCKRVFEAHAGTCTLAPAATPEQATTLSIKLPLGPGSA